MQIDLPDGFILDCACGSGIQLAAYAATLQRPVLGVELAPERAQASAVNVRSVASHTRGTSEAWFLKSRVVCGDGTDAKGVLSAVGENASNVAFLHLDPARPATAERTPWRKCNRRCTVFWVSGRRISKNPPCCSTFHPA